jgi:hypothetical protein
MRTKPCVAIDIMDVPLWVIMQGAVQFDDESCRDTDEVGDIATDRDLAPKFRAYATLSQITPENRFGDRHLSSQTSGVRELTRRAALDHEDRLV